MIKNNYNYGMNINIEEYKSCESFLPGLYKFLENGLFSQAILAVTDKDILIYDDHAPDVVSGDTFTYKVKFRVSLKSIETIVNEKIIGNKDMNGLSRLVFVYDSDNEEDTEATFYYFLDDKKLLAQMLTSLKARGLSIQSRKVDLSKE